MFFTPLDALDIVLVAVLLYQGYKLVANSRTINLVRGLVVFGIVWYGSSVLDLRTIHFILSQIATVGFFALIVVFQPELRAVLERLGRAQAREDAPANVAIQEIIRASERLAERKIGALIALERKTPLGEYAATGVKLDAEVTAVTLETVFARNTPLHDGGVIVQHGRLSSAGCLFPLQAPSGVVQRLYGTRHRAALGLSELSDAIVVVVSEERGSIRIAENGQLSPDLSIPELRERLREGIYHVSQGNKNFLPSAWSSVLRRKSQTFETKKETAPVATPPSEEVSARVN
jgi:diadenylate cyclase